MARIRTIKPEFFTSEDIIGLSPLARLFYISLWCEADREGRMKWQLRSLKVRYLPVDDCDIDEIAAELVNAGLVVPYGDRLAYIPAFTRHQHVNKREAPSKLPGPSQCETVQEPEKAGASTCTHPPSPVNARGEGKGREGKGRRYNARADNSPQKKSKPIPIPDDFRISDRVRAWAAEKGHTNLDARLEHFIGYAKRSGRTYVDWDEAFMSAVREDWAKLAKQGDGTAHWSTQGVVL